jgi:regulator of replication initiation timing
MDSQEVYYKTMISTHEVTIGQQTIRIKKLANNVQYLEQEIKNLKEENDKLVQLLYQDMWDTTASGRGMVEYPFNPEDVSAIYREKYPSVFKPEPYPYTNPIRDVPEYSRIKVKK